MENPIVILSELCQLRYRESIITNVIAKEGPDHCPSITVQIELPDGHVYHGVGSNKKLAKQQAATFALEDLGFE